MALKMIGNTPVELIRVPGASHNNPARPGQALQYWDKVLTWFYKYIDIRAEEYI